jgi:chemosensory pili system protein ChpA (sensor histidine kinase/response regulator)
VSQRSNLPLIPEEARRYFEVNRNVLLIEDDVGMRYMTSHLLSDSGFNVIAAKNGIGIFDKLQQQPIDFIILDILLPVMDGFEIYSMLQANPETKNIPVMIVTAWADERNIKKAAEMGLTHFLAKPFTENELLYEILALLVDHSHKAL